MEEIIMAKIITVKDMDANAIGKYLIGYNCEAGDFKWRIFHVDGKNVYIITECSPGSLKCRTKRIVQ